MIIRSRRSQQAPPKDRWPSWRYGPYGESQVFNSEAEVPSGWTKKPAAEYLAGDLNVLNRDELIIKLVEKGVKPRPTWSSSYMQEILIT